MISVLIVDDEPHARDDLKKKITLNPGFNILGQCANAFEAIKEINKKQPDVVFLDIKMPKISGIEMLSMLDKDNMPRIVFVTAYDEHAIEAFEKNAVDFLLKPVKNDRLNITLNRLKENCKPQAVVANKLSTKLHFVPCYKGTRDYLININDICHVFSSPTSGTHLVTGNNRQEFHADLSLKILEENSALVRCHRQHLVNPDCIKIIDKLENGLGKIHTYDGGIIPVSRKFLKDFYTTV